MSRQILPSLSQNGYQLERAVLCCSEVKGSPSAPFANRTVFINQKHAPKIFSSESAFKNRFGANPATTVTVLGSSRTINQATPQPIPAPVLKNHLPPIQIKNRSQTFAGLAHAVCQVNAPTRSLPSLPAIAHLNLPQTKNPLPTS